MTNRLGLVVMLAAAACGVSDTDPGDGEFDRFATGDGKTDTGGIQEGTPEALGVLHVVNTLTKAQLASDVHLASAAAENIAAYRAGDDEASGTSDDETYDSLRELDSVPFVGPSAFAKLVAYAEAEGFTDDPPGVPATSDDPFDDNACQGAPMSQAAAKARLSAGGGVLGSYQMAFRSCWSLDANNEKCTEWRPTNLNEIGWKPSASGLLQLGNYDGQIKLQTRHGVCNGLGGGQYIDGSVCDGVGHTLYCGTYGYPQRCRNYETGVDPYELTNGHGFALEGKLTENCVQLRKAVRNYHNIQEVAILVRF